MSSMNWMPASYEEGDPCGKCEHWDGLCKKSAYLSIDDGECPRFEAKRAVQTDAERIADLEQEVNLLKCAVFWVAGQCANPLTETMGTTRKDLLQGITKIWQRMLDVIEESQTTTEEE